MSEIKTNRQKDGAYLACNIWDKFKMCYRDIGKLIQSEKIVYLSVGIKTV